MPQTWTGKLAGGPKLTGIVDADPVSREQMGQMQAKLAVCVNYSRAWLDRIDKMEFSLISKLAKKYFYVDQQSEFDRARQVLSATRAGLNSEQEVKFVEMKEHQLGVTRGGRWLIFGEARRVHLNKQSFLAQGGRVNWALVYLHEATHLYANTEDHGYINSFADAYDAESPYRQALTRAQALDNADSYAGFVYECIRRYGILERVYELG